MVSKHQEELVKLLTKIKDQGLMEKFLTDLLTSEEFENLSKRWQLVKLLAKNTPQRKISQDLKVAIATVTRGSKELEDESGGFNKILKKYYSVTKSKRI